MAYRPRDYHESVMIRCITLRSGQVGYTHTHTHSLAAKEEEVQPEPGEDQHDDGDGEAEDEPRAEVYHLRIWITTGK